MTAQFPAPSLAAQVEAVARAIYARDPGYDDMAWDDLPSDAFARLVCLDQARAAIATLERLAEEGR